MKRKVLLAAVTILTGFMARAQTQTHNVQPPPPHVIVEKPALPPPPPAPCVKAKTKKRFVAPPSPPALPKSEA